MTALPPESESPLQSSLAEAAEVSTPKPRVGIGFIAVYGLAMFGIWMAINLPASVTIALRISEIDPEGKTGSYSVVAGIGTLVALLANPFFGRLSDRTRSRFGRRRPWIVIGLLGTAVGAAVIGLSDSIGMLILGWILMQGFINAAIAAALAVVADHVPTEQQGAVGALSGTAAAASTVVGIFFIQAFPTNILAQIGLPVLVAFVFSGMLIAMLRDDKPASGDVPSFSVKEFFGSFFFNPRKAPDFAKFLLAFFVMNIGYGVTSTYAVYYLQDQLVIPEADLTNTIFITLLLGGIAGVVFAPLAGWLSDKIGRRKPVLLAGGALIALGIVLIVTASSTTQFLIGQTLAAGVGPGILLGVYIAFAIETLPDTTNIARDLGIVNIAFTLPFSVAPFVAPAILGIGGGAPNYTLLYIVAGVVTLISVPLLLTIRTAR